MVVPAPGGAEFKTLGDGTYATDGRQVYHRARMLPQADGATFGPIKGNHWRDQTHVFWADEVVAGADPATFRPLEKSWAVDKNDVYAGAIAVHAKDPASFTVLQGVWAKDKLAFYAAGTNHPLACDYASFEILSDNYARDRTTAFWMGIPIEGADAASFRVIKTGLAQDKNGFYDGAKRRR
jgi:hypothetical protein